MSRQTEPVVYEVRLVVDSDIAGEYDAWLEQHIAAMLRFDGFVDADVLEPETQSGDSVVRLVRYSVASREHLDRYFDEHAERMRAEGVERFGERFSATREIYAAGKRPRGSCQNCSASLAGQYCAACGQRDKHRIISLWELFRDLVGDLFEIDSRLWRTLRPLVFRPGRLTVEYLRGRRVHYTPPLRLYLVTSLVFFLIVSFDMGSFNNTFVIDSDEPVAAEDTGAISAETPPGDSDDADAPPIEEPDAVAETSEEKSDPCLTLEISHESLRPTAEAICYKLMAEGGARAFGRQLLDNVPGMMFFFLPAIALAMKLLYPLSRRYYVEHLLFFVHYHSFFFVLLTTTLLINRLPSLVPGQGIATGLLNAAATIYVPVYLYRAMRRVYGQGRIVTALKFVLLNIAYFFGLLLTFSATALITALTV